MRIELKKRTKDFALAIVSLYRKLPRKREADVIGDQVLRSGTSVGAHYREAIRSRSAPEYVAKLNAGLMELEETTYWLELIEGAELHDSEPLMKLRNEAWELSAIFVSLILARKRENNLPL